MLEFVLVFFAGAGSLYLAQLSAGKTKHAYANYKGTLHDKKTTKYAKQLEECFIQDSPQVPKLDNETKKPGNFCGVPFHEKNSFDSRLGRAIKLEERWVLAGFEPADKEKKNSLYTHDRVLCRKKGGFTSVSFKEIVSAKFFDSEEDAQEAIKKTKKWPTYKPKKVCIEKALLV